MQIKIQKIPKMKFCDIPLGTVVRLEGTNTLAMKVQVHINGFKHDTLLYLNDFLVGDYEWQLLYRDKEYEIVENTSLVIGAVK